MRYIKFTVKSPLIGEEVIYQKYPNYYTKEDTDEYIEKEAIRFMEEITMSDMDLIESQIDIDDYESEQEYYDAIDEYADEYYDTCSGTWTEVTYEEFLEHYK